MFLVCEYKVVGDSQEAIYVLISDNFYVRYDHLDRLVQGHVDAVEDDGSDSHIFFRWTD